MFEIYSNVYKMYKEGRLTKDKFNEEFNKWIDLATNSEKALRDMSLPITIYNIYDEGLRNTTGGMYNFKVEFEAQNTGINFDVNDRHKNKIHNDFAKYTEIINEIQ